ncbi:prepilin peptidase [Desulfocurvus vexinensis]|uniref:prepilin peptidase n=1 Tax=Desulfocurvus vexinensis TaxID=399548 RepID=UPI00048B8F1D|nr:prepilin peptidase [Desulfocurvus vexinensis]
MKKTTLSDDIRRLEELRADGFLSERQYLRELHEAMARHEQEVVPDWEPAPDAQDLAAHSSPRPYDPDDATRPETPALHLERDGEPDAPDRDQDPAPGQPEEPVQADLAGPARVIVRGKSPWDDTGDSALGLQSPRAKTQDATAVFDHDKAKAEAEARQREKIARMAEHSNRALRRRRNPDVALLLSLLWAGVGNIYVGQLTPGVGLALLGGACWIGVAYGIYELAWIALPLGLLSGAVARKAADQKNRAIDALTDARLRMQPKVSRLNVEKSLRPGPAAPPKQG